MLWEYREDILAEQKASLGTKQTLVVYFNLKQYSQPRVSIFFKFLCDALRRPYVKVHEKVCDRNNVYFLCAFVPDPYGPR